MSLMSNVTKSETTSCNRLATWLFGGAIVAGLVTALTIYRHYQYKHSQPEFRAERAYQKGLKQVQTIEARIPRWLAGRS